MTLFNRIREFDQVYVFVVQCSHCGCEATESTDRKRAWKYAEREGWKKIGEGDEEKYYCPKERCFDAMNKLLKNEERINANKAN